MSAETPKNVHHIYSDTQGVFVRWMDATTTDLADCPKPALVRVASYCAKADRLHVPKPANGQWLSATNSHLTSYIYDVVTQAPAQRIGRGGEPTDVELPTFNSPLTPIQDTVWTETMPNPNPTTPTPTPAPTSADPAVVGQLLELLGKLGGSSIDPDQVRSIAREELAKVHLPTRVTVHNKRDDATREVKGLTHNRFPLILTALEVDSVMLVGPAGTGKSTIARQCAEALDIPFGMQSFTPTTPLSAVVGYMDANGNYQGPEYRRRYEHGGVFCGDELDNGHPAILGVFNEGLANGHMSFPDGIVTRHADFRFIGTANTYGTGPDRQYVGRQQLDAATLDRFTVVTVPVDEALEENVALAQGASEGDTRKVLSFVRSLRANAETQRLMLMFSPRASIKACALRAAGVDWSDVIAMRIRKGISDQDWSKVTSGVKVPS